MTGGEGASQGREIPQAQPERGEKTPGRKMEKMLLSSKDLIWLILSAWGVLAKCKEEENTSL